MAEVNPLIRKPSPLGRKRFGELLGSIDHGLRQHIGFLASRSRRLKHDVNDIVQEVSLIGWQVSDRFEGSTPQEFLAWLKNIATHTVRNLERSGTRKKRYSPGTVLLSSLSEELLRISSNGAAPQENLKAKLERDDLLGLAMKTIIKKRMDTLLEVYYYERTIKQVSARLGITPSGVKKRLSRSLDELRNDLLDLLDPEDVPEH